MPFANYDAYISGLKQQQFGDFQTNANTGSATRLGMLSRNFVPAPATPTTSVALDKNSDRAINSYLPNGGDGQLSILGARFNGSVSSGAMIMAVDMLNISGGLSGNNSTTQSINLPTAALTRYTTGVGVHAGIIVHTAIGTTATTVTVSYTNETGTSGRTSTAVVLGGAGFREAGVVVRIPLQAGDLGFRSVESVTLAALTGTGGDFGIVLYKPLAMFAVNDYENANLMDCVSTGRMVGQCNEVLDNACLSVFGIFNGLQFISGGLMLGEA